VRCGSRARKQAFWTGRSRRKGLLAYVMEALDQDRRAVGVDRRWGPDADQRAKLLIYQAMKGSIFSAYLQLHRARHLFVRQQTAVINSIRTYLAEFGIRAPSGKAKLVSRSRKARSTPRTQCPVLFLDGDHFGENKTANSYFIEIAK
jgi:hypothetical protein